MQQEHPRRAAYYRAKSAECSILAARVTDPVAVCTFRQLAADYLELASRTLRENDEVRGSKA
jgi:hypothetical protein